MLTTYFKTSVRFLLKNRFYALINIFGLALGIATFLLIALLSVTGQTWKAAHVNPVESLRNE